MLRSLVVAAGLAVTTLPLAPIAVPAATAGTAASSLPLPQPVDAVAPLPGVGLARDRLLTSRVPGPVANREAVTVAVGPAGSPAAVTVEQRFSISGVGDYQIRERGPARGAVGLGDTVPPVLSLGTVIWQGFSPGHRELAARLTLDPGLEAARLPMSVQLSYVDRSGRQRSLRPGDRVPIAGQVTVTLQNETAMPVTVATGAADAGPLGSALQTLLDAATRPRPGRPPVAGAGLPLVVPGSLTGTTSIYAVAPLLVTGVVRVPGTTARVTGPGVTDLPDGARIRGTLTDAVSFRVDVPGPGPLLLDLTVQPWPDVRTLGPPPPSRSWLAWAAGKPDLSARTAATARLTTVAANAARAAEFTPYLDATLLGPTTTSYRYRAAAAAAIASREPVLTPKPAAIAAGAVAALAIAVNLGLLWRRL